MTMHINFITRQCDLCDRDISRPNFGRHREACERKHALAVRNTGDQDLADAAGVTLGKEIGEG